MVTVIERWTLRAEVADRGLQIMEEMDNLVGPAAHEHPGWVGHAAFYQSKTSPNEVLVVYPWRGIEEHLALCGDEEPLLTGFYEKYCTAKRDIAYYEELPVEVEDDHDH